VLVLVDQVTMMGEVFALLHRMSRGARRGADVCYPFPSTMDDLLLSGLLPSPTLYPFRRLLVRPWLSFLLLPLLLLLPPAAR